MDNEILKEGVLELGNTSIDCYVLKDGTRVLSAREMQRALAMVDEGDSKETSGTRLSRYLNQKTLQPFIYKEYEMGHFEPISCYKGDQKINGYEATVLVDICDAFLQARKEITLSPRQKIIADQCEILVRTFAKIGIIALIDEATGYQYDREKKELQLILKVLLQDEKTKWGKMFPLSFYKEIYKVWNIPFTPKNIKNKPSFIGNITIKYVYLNLPGGEAIVKEMKRRTPKTAKGNYTHKLHQWLTEKVGKKELEKVINTVESFASISDSKKEFNTLIDKKYGEKQNQLSMLFPEVDLDVEVETKSAVKTAPLSDFNQKLKHASNFNPNKDKE